MSNQRKLNNLFKYKKVKKGEEVLENLLCKNNCSNINIKKIISHSHITPDNEWYNQNDDEWVLLLEGEAKIEFFDGEKVFMTAGDYLYIPKNDKHKLIYTSANPHCIWLAIHIKDNE